jgi:hypothetical protein
MRPALTSGMRKPSSKRSRRPAADRSATVDIVSQLECAIRYPQATLIGALVGGLVPWFARTLAHEQLPETWSDGNHGLALVMLVVVIGCAVFSGLTVYKFGRATFSDQRKAVGFTLALEGVMLVSHGATSVVALAVLVLINALGNGSNIALARQATCKKREAAARSAATRRSRASQPSAPQSRSAPFPVVDGAAAAVPQRTRTPKAPVRWVAGDVIDVEIVSEQRLLA